MSTRLRPRELCIHINSGCSARIRVSFDQDGFAGSGSLAEAYPRFVRAGRVGRDYR